MSSAIKISIFEVVGSSLCVASRDGQKVFERAQTALKADRNVILSFRNVTALTSAFLNAAIGQLYGIFDEKQIRAQLSVEDVEQDDIVLLKSVVDNAKLYFSDIERYNLAVKEVEKDGDLDL